MKVIILAAGIGSRLKPLTQNVPKSLLKIDNNENILERNINLINKYCDTEIVVVGGYYYDKIEACISKFNNCKLLYNPFFRITNSISSLWFAREEMNDDLIIINADVIVEEELFKYIVDLKEKACVFYDSSIGDEADYKVVQKNGNVLVMSKELEESSGEYIGISKFSKQESEKLRKKIDYMIGQELVNEWYETALVDMVLNDNFNLKAIDVCKYQWTEVDNVNDLLKAKEILFFDNK